jgi:hypothetical protein
VEDFAYSSAHPGFELDAVPQGLKPQINGGSNGAAEAAPFRNKIVKERETSSARDDSPVPRETESIPSQTKAKTA